MMRSKANKLSKLVQITRAPIRVVCKARDFYVKSMLNFAGSGKAGYGGIGGGTAQLPKSFSVNSSRAVDDDEEFKKLLRLLSAKGISQVETYLHCRQDDGRSYSKGSSGMKSSYSVGVGKIGRIDEDRACSFREMIMMPMQICIPEVEVMLLEGNSSNT
ncbi:hypothetical protein P3X46_024886 [Hevea brasiliensis]|uniref:Uncharacterized protein n=1 Tax=Hevea brasiliensis TaxID=3981 RepID=A0ABQ9L7A3_HEVBR|nr:uncharacterized protein LOC131172907 [Hevea brasiliensis]KAJ9159377.1 hypothetical protein P3X46_024886 [Hevea brasiliensis]